MFFTFGCAGLVCVRNFDLYACWPDGLPNTTVGVRCPWYLPWHNEGRRLLLTPPAAHEPTTLHSVDYVDMIGWLALTSYKKTQALANTCVQGCSWPLSLCT